MVITKEEALELFADNPFKVKILSTKVADGSRTTVYRCGDLIDLCRGPHVSNTGKVKAFAAAKHSAAYWLGDAENDSLQRLYGISFPDKKQLKVWQENMEKVSKNREHGRRMFSLELLNCKTHPFHSTFSRLGQGTRSQTYHEQARTRYVQ